MTDLYSYKSAYPYPLPEDMTPYDLADFVLAPPAPVTAPGEKLEWGGVQWSVREPNEAEIAIQWASVRAHRNELLTASDVFVVRAYEAGQPVSPETVAYRQALRDVTNQTNPFAIVWPTVSDSPIPV